MKNANNGFIMQVLKECSSLRLSLEICFVTIIGSLFAGVGIGLFVPVIELLSSGDVSGRQEGFLGLIIKSLAGLNIAPSLLFFIAVIFTCILLQAVFEFFRKLLTAKLRDDVTKCLRDRSFENLMEVSLQYYHHKKVGELTSIIGDEGFRGGIAVQFLSDIIASLTISLIYIIILALISWQVTIFVIGLSLVSLFSLKGLLRKSKKLGHEKGGFKSAITSFCFENLSSYFLVNIFNRQNEVKKQFFNLTEQIRCNLRKLSLHNALIIFSNTMIRVTAVCVLIYMLYQIMHLSIGYLATVLLIITQLAPKISEINVLIQGFFENSSGLRNIFELTLKDGKPYIINGNKKIAFFNRCIEFKDANFEYIKNRPVLRQINLRIEKGKIIAIIGASGSGKSTLVSLIPRLYEIQSGSIEIDGINLRDLDIFDWRSKIGFISQDTFIYNDSIRNNLLLAKMDAQELEINEALRMAHLDEFIHTLPKSLDTVVGDRGVKLSGGQKQRIAIARVFLKNPPILILDEATSSLDNISERFIQDSINELSKNRTVIVIAHRLSTIKNADMLFVLEEGQIVEQGSPESLDKLDGRYSKYLKASVH